MVLTSACQSEGDKSRGGAERGGGGGPSCDGSLAAQAEAVGDEELGSGAMQAEIEDLLEDGEATGWGVGLREGVVSVYLPTSCAMLADVLRTEFGEAVEVEQGPPIRPVNE